MPTPADVPKLVFICLPQELDDDEKVDVPALPVILTVGNQPAFAIFSCSLLVSMPSIAL